MSWRELLGAFPPRFFRPVLAGVVQPCCRGLLAVIGGGGQGVSALYPLPVFFLGRGLAELRPGGIEERFPVFGVHVGDDGLGEFPDLGVHGEVHLVGRDVSNHDLCDLPDDPPDRGMYLVFPASGR